MTKVSTILDKEDKIPLVPIKLLYYVVPSTEVVALNPTKTKASYYANIVKLRGEHECIVMCWNEENSMHSRDIFIAEWNDGVV